MRYIRKEMIVRVIVDDEVTDPSAIRDILVALHKAKSDIALVYKRDEMEVPMTHSRARILSVGEDTFDVDVINKTHTMIVRKIPINMLDSLTTSVTPTEIFVKK